MTEAAATDEKEELKSSDEPAVPVSWPKERDSDGKLIRYTAIPGRCTKIVPAKYITREMLELVRILDARIAATKKEGDFAPEEVNHLRECCYAVRVNHVKLQIVPHKPISPTYRNTVILIYYYTGGVRSSDKISNKYVCNIRRLNMCWFVDWRKMIRRLTARRRHQKTNN